jgi:hypothetical protein
MVSESFIYVKLKNYLLSDGWTAVAGDPPRGTDLPPLEVKEPNTTHSLRKNANSVIFDLVFGQKRNVLLIECKDNKSKAGQDIRKLRKVCQSREWRSSLLDSLNSGPFLNSFDISLESIRDGDSLTPCIAHPNEPIQDLPDFVQFCVRETGIHTVVGSDIVPFVRESL